MNLSRRFALLLVCGLLLFLSPLLTETRAIEVSDFTFSHLGKAEGLESQRIFSVCQTSSGALWWSSKAGVDRYNGAAIRNYLLGGPSTYARQGGRVVHLSTDGKVVYAFDNRGSIYVYQPVQDRFQFLASVSEKMGHEVALNDIHVSPDGLLLAMHDGVYQLRDTTLTAVTKNGYVNSIVQMEDRLLFCGREGVFDQQGRKLLPYNAESGYYDPLHHKLWIGGYENGLHLVTMDKAGNVASEQFVRLNDHPNQYPIRCIRPYDDTTMLIGIDGLGVYQTPRDGTGQGRPLFDANEAPHAVLHGNGVYSIVVDSWQNIVVGTYSGGIDIARPVGSTTAIFEHMPNNPQSLKNDHVNTVAQLSDHLLLMGTDNGISIWDSRKATWQHLGQGTVVLHLTKMPDGSLLASTYGKGVFRIDANGLVRQAYSTADGTLRDDHVYATFCDRDHRLWMGCLSGDLVSVDANGQTAYYPVDNVQTIVQLPSGQMAVGTAFGLKLVKPGSKDVETLDYAPEGVTDVCPFVTHLFLHDGQLWIATDGGGVYIYDLKTRKSRQLTKTDGLPSDYVSSLTSDRSGRIWIATEEGLAFVPQTSSARPTIVNVNYCYGLDREYTRGAVAPLADGDILYGTTTGALISHPDDLHPINYTAELHILRVSCSNDDSEFFNEQVHRMLERDEIRLGYGQRTFDIYFESINMRNHFDIAYRYKMGDGEWSQESDRQQIRFANLEPGRHTFTLQCVSRTNATVIDELTLTITISQPWWNSWWMWICYMLFIVLLFYGAWHIYQLHEKYMRLTIDYLQLTRKDTANTISNTVRPANEEEEEDLHASEDEEANSGKEFVDTTTKLILERLSDTDFTIDQLCREMAMSRTLFYVKLKSYTGKSPQDFIRIIRLERASALLRSGRSVTDAAALTGFDNPKYFSTVFKKYFGVPPSKYQ